MTKRRPFGVAVCFAILLAGCNPGGENGATLAETDQAQRHDSRTETWAGRRDSESPDPVALAPTVGSSPVETPVVEPASDSPSIWLPVELTAEYADEADNRVLVEVDRVWFEAIDEKTIPAKPLDDVPDEMIQS